ncbi:hypothetical protein [Celeribacter naphthalenivorans]|uniref:hypothetical protein n=1 Tax=Celeribacter naphthalenivorans TaxID=1614694 RepID=UPI001CF9946F|nr:hypothetical protein [Celeribacter naphthalenivorans]
MSVRLEFADVTQLKSGVWSANLPLKLINMFNSGASAQTNSNILLVSRPEFNSSKSVLSVDLVNSEILSLGRGGETLIVSREGGINGALEGKSEASKAQSTYGGGIMNFIKEARSHGLPRELVDCCEVILKELSDDEAFGLNEGRQRKWTADPNFLALTIQNRNRQFLVSVKGNPSKMKYKTIHPKVSRPPYCEFHFARKDQCEEVIEVIRKSRAF